MKTGFTFLVWLLLQVRISSSLCIRQIAASEQNSFFLSNSSSSMGIDGILSFSNTLDPSQCKHALGEIVHFHLHLMALSGLGSFNGHSHLATD
jgi:hypothetical protein